MSVIESWPCQRSILEAVWNGFIRSLSESGLPVSVPETGYCDTCVSDFRERDAALANALGLTTCLKPDVALMLELYEAGKMGKAVTVSVLGMQGGIAPTTTLRYLEALQKKGAVRRVAHETDNRMTYVELTESAQAAMDAAFGG